MIKPLSKFWHDKRGQVRIFSFLLLLLGVVVAIPLLGESGQLLDEGFTSRNFVVTNENITLVGGTNVSLANTNVLTGITLFNTTRTLTITENTACTGGTGCNATVYLLTGQVEANLSVIGAGNWSTVDNTTLANYTFTRVATTSTSSANKTLSELVIAFGALAILFGILRSTNAGEQ